MINYITLFILAVDLVWAQGNLGGTYDLNGKNIKIIEEKLNEEDAIKECSKWKSNATLLTIHSKEEQKKFINEISKFNNISSVVWIGLNYNKHNKAFKWSDGSDIDYNNWDEGSPVLDESLSCVQMSLGNSNLGKWMDQSCKKLALVVCQYEDIIDHGDLRSIVDNLVKTVKRQQNEINELRDSTLPNGFIYTQLPKQLEPTELWPNTEWEDVTKKYAGLFFRAEGGHSAQFGEIQHANQSRIPEVIVSSSEFKGWRDDVTHYNIPYELEEGKLVDIRPGGQIFRLIFKMPTSDVRPYNTAIRIWKRTK